MYFWSKSKAFEYVVHKGGFRKINHFHLNLNYLLCVTEQRSIFLLIVSVCANFGSRGFYFSHKSAGSRDPLYHIHYSSNGCGILLWGRCTSIVFCIPMNLLPRVFYISHDKLRRTSQKFDIFRFQSKFFSPKINFLKTIFVLEY